MRLILRDGGPAYNLRSQKMLELGTFIVHNAPILLRTFFHLLRGSLRGHGTRGRVREWNKVGKGVIGG